MTKRLLTLAMVCAASLLTQESARAVLFKVQNLVTDDQTALMLPGAENAPGTGYGPALIVDPDLQNGWGLTATGASPIWISENGSGRAAVYTVNPTTNVTTISATTKPHIPGDGSVTGEIMNAGAAVGNFNQDNFLFVSEDGTVSGWRGALGGLGTAETFQAASPNNVYKGVARTVNPLGTAGGTDVYLYAANFKSGAIDVIHTAGPNLPGSFVDPGIPAGYAPFNIENLGGTLYVTYAQQGAGKDEVDGAGLGYVSAFALNGTFLGRVASNGTLNAPWGLALAPSSWDGIAGDLLVGNFGDGSINIFNLASDTFLGQLLDVNGNPIILDGLWDLMAGNNGNGGSTQKIYFAGGPNGEENGVFGVITLAAPEPSVVFLIGTGLAALGWNRRKKPAA